MGKIDITVEQALYVSGIRPIKQNGREIFFRCPHCGNPKGKLKCSANTEKGVYGCFQCGNGGNMADLFIAETGFTGSKKEAWREMRRRMNGEQTEVSPTEKNVFPFEKAKIEAEAQKANAATIDKTYRTMLSFLELKPEHKEDLLRRTLTEEEIDEGMFASLPLDRTGICKKLLHAGCRLEGVPGFLVNRRGEWELNGRPGYLCPAFQSGKIAGIQIRVDKPTGGCKYAWLSSSQRYKGTSSGSPCSFYGNPWAKEVIMTEGILKSYVIYQLLDHRRAVMGVPGVNAIKTAMDVLKSHKHKVVVEAYDMDKRMTVSKDKVFPEAQVNAAYQSGDMDAFRKMSEANQSAYASDLNKQKMLTKALKKLNSELSKCGFDVQSNIWDVDPSTGAWLGNYKGLDDYLSATLRGQ